MSVEVDRETGLVNMERYVANDAAAAELRLHALNIGDLATRLAADKDWVREHRPTHMEDDLPRILGLL